MHLIHEGWVPLPTTLKSLHSAAVQGCHHCSIIDRGDTLRPFFICFPILQSELSLCKIKKRFCILHSITERELPPHYKELSDKLDQRNIHISKITIFIDTWFKTN